MDIAGPQQAEPSGAVEPVTGAKTSLLFESWAARAEAGRASSVAITLERDDGDPAASDERAAGSG